MLELEDVCTEFVSARGVVRAVDRVSLGVAAGERVGIVGESGSGKTMLALSVLGLVPQPGRVVSGRVLFHGQDVLAMDQEERRRLRGAHLAMSFQDPMTSLNPLMRISSQIEEAITAHERVPSDEADERVLGLMRQVRIAAPESRAGDYPHQFSGGMRQRVMIAMGVSNQPELLIADEATTALDVTVQAQIATLLRRLSTDLGTAILLITHNLALAAGLCERLVVMYAGRIVEDGPVERILKEPQHPYTWYLLRSVPSVNRTRSRPLVRIAGAPPDLSRLPAGCTFHPRCAFRVDRCTTEEPPLAESRPGQRTRCWVQMDNVPASARSAEAHAPPAPVRGVSSGRPGSDPASDAVLRVENVAKYYQASGSKELRAVDGVSFTIRRNETFALIGESGCGKSTLAKIIACLTPATHGRVIFDGTDLSALSRGALRKARRRLQVVFQDPFSSLDPRMTIAKIVAEPLANFGWDTDNRRQRVRELLDMVGLGADVDSRYPHELSGGQRQRVGIARALAPEPSLVICDEPVSSLDVSIQAQILNLLQDLQNELGLTYLFISHDLGVVRQIADSVAVMYLGTFVEVADADDLYRRPQHPYSKALLEALPVPDLAAVGRDSSAVDTEPPSPADSPAGCLFHPRCPIAQVPAPCSDRRPRLEPHGAEGQVAACHFAGDS